jgi:hypothetical protein
MRITTARSSMVSGMAPIPARAAIANVGMVSSLRVVWSQRIAGRLRWCPAFSSPRRSSLPSAFFPPKIVSASSTSSVGGMSPPMARYTAAGVAFTVISGAWQVPSTTSSSRDFPQRFSGARMTRRGACAQDAWACVAAIHRATAMTASADGRMT